MATKTMKRHDTLPDLVVRVIDTNGSAVNLTDAAVTFSMRQKGHSEVKFKKEATVVAPASDGRIKYLWEEEDTETSGTFYGEFEIAFGVEGADGKMTLPIDKSLIIQINRDLDNE